MASQQRLTLVFEADTTRALNQLNTLSSALDKLTGKSQGNTSNSGIDSLFDAAIAKSQQLERQVELINRSVSKLSNNNLTTSLSNWNNQAKNLESNFAKSATAASRIGEQAKKAFGEIPKSLEVKLNAIAAFTGEKKAPQTVEERRKARQKLFDENQGIREEFTQRQQRRTVNKEDQEIKQRINNERVREQINRAEKKQTRERQAEAIIQGLARQKQRESEKAVTEEKPAKKRSPKAETVAPEEKPARKRKTKTETAETEEKPTRKRTPKAETSAKTAKQRQAEAIIQGLTEQVSVSRNKTFRIRPEDVAGQRLQREAAIRGFLTETGGVRRQPLSQPATVARNRSFRIRPEDVAEQRAQREAAIRGFLTETGGVRRQPIRESQAIARNRTFRIRPDDVAEQRAQREAAIQGFLRETGGTRRQPISETRAVTRNRTFRIRPDDVAEQRLQREAAIQGFLRETGGVRRQPIIQPATVARNQKQTQAAIQGFLQESSGVRRKPIAEPEPEVKPKATRQRKKKATAEETEATPTPKTPASLFSDRTFLGTYQPPSRNVLTRRQVEEQEQLREQRTARRARNESVFSSQRFGSKLSNEATTELNNAGSEQINQRLQGILERNRAKEAEDKRVNEERQAELIRLRAEVQRKQAERERNRIEQNRQIRESSKRADQNRFQSRESTRGMGFGASNFGRIAEQRSAERASVPRASRQIFGAALQTAEPLLGNQFQQISQTTQQLATGLSTAFGIGQTAAVGLASVISVGIVGAINLAIAGVSELGRQFEEAKKDQLALLGISSETQRLFNVDQKTADDFYQNLQVKTEIAGRDTSVEASQITDLNTRGFAAFLTTFQDSGESLDSIANRMVDINTRYSILAQATPGVTNFQVQNAYTSAVTGDLGKAITRQEFFRNSGFAEVIKQVASDRGVDLNKADRRQQVEILEEALKLRVPKELVDRAQNDSITAQQSSLMDKLFSPRIGYFGIQRDTDLDEEGTQSVFSELTRTVKIVLGQGGLFDQIGRTFGFIDLDIMDGLRRGIQGLNDFLEALSRLLNKFNNLNQTISSIKVPGTDIQIGGATNTLLSNAFIPNGVLAGNIAGGIKNTVQATGNVFSQGFDFVKGLFGFGNSFTGNIPEVTNNYSNQSVFDAIATERKHAPANSNLLIANDSEYIFKNQQQLTDFIQSSYKNPVVNVSPEMRGNTRENKVYFTQGAIQINATTQNPEAIANMVIEKINNMFTFEMGATF